MDVTSVELTRPCLLWLISNDFDGEMFSQELAFQHRYHQHELSSSSASLWTNYPMFLDDIVLVHCTVRLMCTAKTYVLVHCMVQLMCTAKIESFDLLRSAPSLPCHGDVVHMLVVSIQSLQVSNNSSCVSSSV